MQSRRADPTPRSVTAESDGEIEKFRRGGRRSTHARDLSSGIQRFDGCRVAARGGKGQMPCA